MHYRSLTAFLVLMFLLTSGCQTPPVFPLSHLQSPEVHSEQISLKAGLGSSPMRAIFLAPESIKGSTSATLRSQHSYYDDPSGSKAFRIWIPEWPLDWTIPEFGGPYVGTLDLNLGSRLSFFYLNPLFGLKVQVLGEVAQKAKKGNFSASLIAGYTYQYLSSSNLELAIPSSELNGSMSLKGLSAGLVIGYRLADNGGIALDLMGAQHEVRGSGFVDGQATKEDLTGQNTDVGAGIQLFVSSEKSSLLIEQMWTQIHEPVRDEYVVLPSLHVLFSTQLF